VALIVAVALLLCGGAVTSVVLIANRVADRAKEAVKPITEPAVPTEAPAPTKVPDLPAIPTDLPDLPTFPALPGANGAKIAVKYQVTGDGPAEILYTSKLGEQPKRVSNAKLPWTFSTTMDGAAFVSVTAVRKDADDGTIGCRTTVDGEEVARGSRTGSFAAVSCSKLIFK
jgi:hypothetical protein